MPAYLARRMQTTPHSPPSERKQGTVLVGEVEGWHALCQAAAPEVVDDVWHHGCALLVAEVCRVEGCLSQVAGPGFTALFGAPLACEDHVLRALHAALGIQRAFMAYAAEVQQTLGVSLGLRLGVHTGPLVVHTFSTDLQLAYTAPGATLDLATRLQQLAPVGTVAVSAAVHGAAVGFFRFTPLSQHLLPEGLAAVPVYTCDGVGPVTSRLAGALARGQTPFQGRTRELAFLEHCWTRACQGVGQIVCLVGEAGVGKSRLAYECQQRLADARWLTLQALPYGQAMPYHAFLPVLRTVLGVPEHADPLQQQQALQTYLAVCEPSLAAEAPFLAHVLGLPGALAAHPPLAPEVQRRRVQQACLQVLVQQADAAPLGVLVEDGHWLDPSSQDLLGLLGAALARRPILVLCTARPGFRHPWADYTYFHQVAIEPLVAEETDALLRDLLQPYEASAALQALIHERTRGNPFFVEELVRAMQGHGLLTVQGGVYEGAAEARAMLPVSIQGIVQARLDGLPVAEKCLLQIAAVLGTEVPFPLLQAIAELPEDTLDRGLAHLQAAEFLYETQRVPERAYTFKHALTQEVAYRSLLQERRRELHTCTVEALEALARDQMAAQVERLAHHAVRGEVWAKALTYCRQAGEKALARPAYHEAVGYFEQALSMLSHLPETRATREQAIDLRFALRNACFALGAYERIRDYLRDAATLAEAVGDHRRLGQSALYLSQYCSAMGDHERALVSGQRALVLGTLLGDGTLQGLAHYHLGVAAWALGDYSRAGECLTRSRAFLTGDQFRLPLIASRVYLGLCLAALGEFVEGLTHAEEAVRLAEAVDNPLSLTLAWRAVGSLYLSRGEFSRAIAILQLGQDLCHVAHVQIWLPPIAATLGYAYALAGCLAEAVPLLEQAVEQDTSWRGGGYVLGVAWLGEAYLLANRMAEARVRATRALALAQTRKERANEAWTRCLLGAIAMQCEPLDAMRAEDHYRQALALADALGMRPLVAHCHRSLGTLYAQTGRREQARTALSTAIEMYRAMAMTFWLPQTEVALARVEEE
jgi:tetratricopeptide (TPR) repeat protein/class 3 adenylate cyclase